MEAPTPTRAELTAAERVVSAVAAATGEDPMRLGPLYDAVDPDVLNGFVRQGPRSSENRLVFYWAGCEVTLHGDGRIRIGRDTAAGAATRCKPTSD